MAEVVHIFREVDVFYIVLGGQEWFRDDPEPYGLVLFYYEPVLRHMARFDLNFLVAYEIQYHQTHTSTV